MAELSELYGQAGFAIGGMLRDRHHAYQYEQFQQNEYAEYQQSIQNSLITMQENPEDPDATAQAFLSQKAATNKFLGEVGKFSSNPMIAQLGNAAFTYNRNSLDEFTQAEEAGEERAGRPATKELERREAEAGIGLKEAQTKERQAMARLHGRMPAARAGADAAANLFTHEARTPAQALRQLSRNEPRFREARKLEMGQIRRDLAQQLLSERRGTAKPGAVAGKWGDDPDDTKSIAANEISNSVVRREWEKRKLTEEGWPLAAFGGLYDDALKREEEIPAVQGNILTDRLGVNLLGKVGFELVTADLDVSDLRKLTPSNLVQKLPADWRDLDQDGPLPAMLSTAAEGLDPTTKRGFNDWQTLIAFMRALGEKAVQARVGGQGIPDRQLAVPTQRSRARARAIVKAVIGKYSHQIASELGLSGVPEKPDKPLFPKGTLLRQAEEKAKSFWRLLEVGETED